MQKTSCDCDGFGGEHCGECTTLDGCSVANLPAQPEAGFHDKKFDAGKSRMDLLPWAALVEVGQVLAYGCLKYSEDSWQTVPQAKKRYTAALLRHLGAWQDGEDRDPESGFLHVSHVATNGLFLCWLVLKGKG